MSGKIPSKKVFEADRVYASEEVKPQAPTHVLIVPKKHIVDIKEAGEADAEIIGYCNLVAAKIARERQIEHGYRTVFNVGPGSGQSVFHFHPHLLARRTPSCPPQ